MLYFQIALAKGTWTALWEAYQVKKSALDAQVAETYYPPTFRSKDGTGTEDGPKGLLRRNSMVEWLAVNQQVAGSSPAAGAGTFGPFHFDLFRH
jgi:hypothetical protein